MGSCISGGGGGQCHTQLLVLGEGGWRWQDIRMYTFDLFTLSIDIHKNRTVIPCFFLPLLAENNESYHINVKKTYAPLPPFGPYKNFLNSNLVSKIY